MFAINCVTLKLDRKFITEFAYSFVYLNLGLRGGCYSQVASISTDQSLEKLLVDKNLPNGSCLDSNDGVAKIREKFDLAKQRFLKIPDALEKMPKMNPKGRNFLWISGHGLSLV